MSETNTRLTPPAASKELPLIESELNRGRLFGECVILKNPIQGLAQRAHAMVDSAKSTIPVLHEEVTTMRSALTGFQNHKSSLISTVLNVVRQGTNLWTSLRSRFQWFVNELQPRITTDL